jgi:hypothetical protein
MLSIFPPVLGYPDHLVLNVRNGMLCPSNPNADVINEKALIRKAPQSRPAASRFPFSSLLAGIHPEVP